MTKRLAILWHEREDLEWARRKYAVCRLADIWEGDGIEVVHLLGPRRFAPADALLVHVDLSVVPDAYLELAARYPRALNAELRDIRKSSFSEQRLTGTSSYSGKVIVKTELNARGRPELRLAGSRSRRRIARLASKFIATGRYQSNYPVYDSFADVPSKFLRRDRRFIVEKFLPEVEDDLYRIRYINILGDRVTGIRLASESPMVKGFNHAGIERLEIGPELHELRKRLGLDFAKIDCVVRDGEIVLLDINKTPGGSRLFDEPMFVDMLRYRAAGIHAYLD
ncbi:MAG: hypothetical protein ACRD0Q_08065 [Acidimicrobiales bacterium]